METQNIEQIRKQYQCVVKLCENLALVHKQTGELLDRVPPGVLELMGRRSAEVMNLLGDVLNNMDAVDEKEDAWMEPVFEEARRLWLNNKISNSDPGKTS